MNDFAVLYDAHHARHPQDLPFWLSLLPETSGDVLELGCGTGRVLLPIGRALVGTGRSLVGLDNDPAMLAVASQRLADEPGLPVSIQVGDMTDFRVKSACGLIILPLNTYSALSTEARRAALNCIAAGLASGGLFAAALPNPALLLHLPAHSELQLEETFLHPSNGRLVRVLSGWERDEQAFRLRWVYETDLPDGRIEQVEAAAVHHLTPAKTYLDELAGAGLEPAFTYGNYRRRPFIRRSEYLILVARKPS
jgi:SAM-dependent methyltransferase